MEMRRGLMFGFLAYFIWGFFPFYFKLIAATGPVEIVAHRAMWSFVFCLLLLLVSRRWRSFTAALRQRRAVLALGLASLLLATNWTIYVWAVNTDRTVDGALGYFVTPLVSMVLGVAFARERLRAVQWVACGFGAAAVVVLAVGLGEFPFIALSLGLTFGTYGLVKKRAGAAVAPLPGLAIETMTITPLALGYVIWLSSRGQATVDLASAHGALVAAAGVVTAVPLLFFAAAAARISLVTIGVLQYITPTLQFLTGWLVFGEPMPPERWAGFALVWFALVLFVADGARHQRATRRFQQRGAATGRAAAAVTPDDPPAAGRSRSASS